MKGESSRSRLLKLACLAVLIGPMSRGQDLGPLLDQSIQSEIAKLHPNSQRLPELAADIKPPPLIESAGKDFVAAWRAWAVVMTPRPGDQKVTAPPDRKDLINTYVNWDPFQKLLKRAIEANPPPETAEFSRFTYSSQSWCGSDGYGFGTLYNKGLILTLLRHGQYIDAIRQGVETEVVLQSFGVDPEEFRIGGWLNEAEYPATLCRTGGERTARMLMDWVDLRWDVELARFKKSTATGNYERPKEPAFPRADLIHLLRPDNGVTDETKARIARFIETRSLEMIPLQTWLYGCPKGAEKWLVPIARRGLTHELNEIRKRASRLLTAAGVDHPEPEMRPDPRFSVLLNARIWPGEFGHPGVRPPGLPLSLQAGNSSWSSYLAPDCPGFFTVDFDSLMHNGPLLKAEIRQSPITYRDDWAKPTDLWLRAKVPLPIDFFHVNQIEMETYDFTIRPKFPERVGTPEEEVYEVDFDMADDGKGEDPPREGYCRLLVKGRQSLSLPTVSPGDYWVQIRHAGAVLIPRKRVTVSWWCRSVDLKFETGASLVVPVEWPEAKDAKNLPPAFVPDLVWFGHDAHESLRSVIRLKRKDGSVVGNFGRLPISARGRFPNSVIFPYLPPGEYEVESPDRTIEPAGTAPGCVIRKTSIKVEIRKDSPVFVVTGPLKVDYSRKD